MAGRSVFALAVLAASAAGLPAQPPGSPGPTPAPPSLPEANPGGAPVPPGVGQPGGVSGGGLGLPGGVSGPGAQLGGTVPPIGTPVAPGQMIVLGGATAAVPRPPLHIPATAKAKDLLPTPPAQTPARPVLADDLAKVPEVAFAERPAKDDPSPALAAAHQLAKIAHLNAKKTDAFMAALLENRPDLAGLPFVMGDDCRTAGERARQFAVAVAIVRQARGGLSQVQVEGLVVMTSSGVQPAPTQTPAAPPPGSAPTGGFWDRFRTLSDQDDVARPKGDKALAEHVALARMAALTQMLAADPAEVRAGLVKYLAGVAHPEATRHLARMAIFSPEDDVRLPALDALKVRRERDYTDILVKGLSYPWPAVAGRAADAVARLDRKDLIPDLVAVLDRADPRLPKSSAKGTFVRELVKVNHHRNCMMCHPSGQPGQVPDAAMTAEVPVQGQPLPSPSQGYGRSAADLMVRIDVTYLRPDFSATLTVPDAHPWPDAQRFDFVVRERELSAAEADAFEEKLVIREPGVVSPYHKAALAALRELTGKDAAPTAAAWRELLKLKRVD